MNNSPSLADYPARKQWHPPVIEVIDRNKINGKNLLDHESTVVRLTGTIYSGPHMTEGTKGSFAS